MGFIASFRRKAAIKKYVKVLGPELRTRFGKKRTYVDSEVCTTVEDLGLSKEFMAYALALYCDKKSYDSVSNHPNIMVLDYVEARAVAFNIAMVVGLSSSSDSNDFNNSDSDLANYSDD